MHLINIKTLALEEFIEGGIPEYAILSHRWTKEELNFKEVLKERADPDKKGYRKLVGACRVAAGYHVDYLWIDTCCIDKRSSAELSEAINSMYAWYENAKICIAYLEDVEAGPNFDETFRASVWFTRSWTLQELLAPDDVEFYDGNWTLIADRKYNAHVISEITGIQRLVLSRDIHLKDRTIAEKMSWAAGRTASRSEDIAYSLLGLFGVNLALLYGEGSRAFQRLLEEIIRRTEDTTVLIGERQSPIKDPMALNISESSLLAAHPSDFRHVQKMGPLSYLKVDSVEITNAGLEIMADLTRLGLETYCFLIARGFNWTYGFCIRRVPWKKTFYRVGTIELPLQMNDWRFESRKFVVMFDNEGETCKFYEKCRPLREADFGFAIRFDGQNVLDVTELQRYNEVSKKPSLRMPTTGGEPRIEILFNIRAEQPSIAKVRYRLGEDQQWTIYLSFDFDNNPCALVCQQGKEPPPWTVFPFLVDNPQQSAQVDNIMASVRSKHIEQGAYFFRGLSRDMATYANFPEDLLVGSRPLTAWFIPFYTGAERGLWRFEISASQQQRPLKWAMYRLPPKW